ncbi:2-hydroxychromene-2-carboxylate isomerase [Noviherbaspirillum sp. CPCC 100848]|uniref:2-hydroxychromene-2-carboxylate isomerase n=1 Tax=Noviherbaspirillum album TaxID=3080276 RepID=A0ABU6J9E1_9BURK|nr:2-hydroxychromene-2-carboxylate isomerase [Noviherbaspirillum sp. CPCC 100848]MEC4720271.1 2-hydroxychromene-2-carboxylate isomerase [Noviherbaspirillum sp. CPCC 100848]
MAQVCQYFFAPQSPWTYLGHERFVALAKKHGAQIELKPCDLGKVFSVSGGVPLAKRAPQRQAYRLVELKRWSEHLQMPMNLQPAFFPVAGDAAAMLIIAARLAHGTDAALALAGAVMRAVWAEERNIADAATLAAIARECGLDGQALVKTAETSGVQEEYNRHTEEAIAANVFGSPWYVVDGEGYWGQDRLDFVERALQK